MEITVKVIAILDAQRFTSQRTGNEYIKNTFVGETQGQYPKKIAFSVMGEDKFKQMNIVVGGNYNVSFDVESREWQQKWFTEASAWKAVCLDGQQQAPVQQPQTAAPAAKPAPAPAPQPQQQTEESGGGENADDMPF